MTEISPPLFDGDVFDIMRTDFERFYLVRDHLPEKPEMVSKCFAVTGMRIRSFTGTEQTRGKNSLTQIDQSAN